MASLGKKILSAFVEVTEDEQAVTKQEETKEYSTANTATGQTAQCRQTGNNAAITEKFMQYFDKLFTDANLPGPDYFEFVKITEAMKSILRKRPGTAQLSPD
jgi:hypothetical protein